MFVNGGRIVRRVVWPLALDYLRLLGPPVFLMAVVSILTPFLPFVRPIANGYVFVAVTVARMAFRAYRVFGYERQVMLREIWDANFLERKEMLNRKDLSPDQLQAETKPATPLAETDAEGDDGELDAD